MNNTATSIRKVLNYSRNTYHCEATSSLPSLLKCQEVLQRLGLGLEMLISKTYFTCLRPAFDSCVNRPANAPALRKFLFDVKLVKAILQKIDDALLLVHAPRPSLRNIEGRHAVHVHARQG
jgi:hypothetical protein